MSEPRSLFPALYRRRPDPVEAMQWNPADRSMQDVLTWLREEEQVFKTVGRQVWVEFGETPNKGWMIAQPGDYILRRLGERRYFYSESEAKFVAERESMAEAATERGE